MDIPVHPTDGNGDSKAEGAVSAESPVEVGAGVAVLEMEEEALDTQAESVPEEPEPAARPLPRRWSMRLNPTGCFPYIRRRRAIPWTGGAATTRC